MYNVCCLDTTFHFRDVLFIFEHHYKFNFATIWFILYNFDIHR